MRYSVELRRQREVAVVTQPDSQTSTFVMTTARVHSRHVLSVENGGALLASSTKIASLRPSHSNPPEPDEYSSIRRRKSGR